MSPVPFLLVDDLEDNLVSLEALLRRDDLLLLKARSGDEALELLLHNDVALALIDVQMPGLNGFELAELMRGNERTRRIPIIFVTAGSADNQRRFRGYGAGAVDFIQKPIEPDILRSKADVFFELYQQRQMIAAQRDELEVQAEALREAGRRKDEFLITLTHDVHRHQHAREQQEMLLREINHRIKNLFAVAVGLIEFSTRAAGSAEELASDLRARLQALARVHDLTLPDLSSDGEAQSETTAVALLNAILAPYRCPQSTRISVSGDDIVLAGNALTSLALLLHEFTTNAAKYGALSQAQGRLTIHVTSVDDRFHMTWVEQASLESGTSPSREGFGSVLEKAVLRAMGGTVSRDWTQDGLSLTLEIPMMNIAQT
ncbi:response regulator [Ancylobacter sp. MQZ15Z-1]|uniref:histidine kinase n=1 Tax=Ancylobacter mangrovi TaxID=2972472 RepID=A0A9X2T283_9HYPH|nr:response regulator [Ancylobacter mangrovi]MCS0495622.1 response regulator [Ancylobacter mangrovi]